MEVDEGNQSKVHRHANFEAVDDEEFFEFQEVESYFNLTPVNEDDPTSSPAPTHKTNELGELVEIPQCRFCWGQNTEGNNPLISSCKCKGGIRYIHLNCLMQWLSAKKNIKNGDNYCSYFWKSFECEICKTAYPLMIKSNGTNFHLVHYDRPQTSYLVLESLNQEKNTSRIVHIIKPTAGKDVFKMGRGHESDLRINDISVSRLHAMIKYKEGKFLLEDNVSKFGTLVLISKRTPLSPGFNKAVQIGRTVINFSVKSLGSSSLAKSEAEFGKVKTTQSDGTTNQQLGFTGISPLEHQGDDDEDEDGGNVNYN